MVNVYFDSATIYYRAFYAVPEKITAPDGTPSGAVRGFLDMVSTLLNQFPADKVAFAWDDDWRPQWRVALVPSYKTHRLDEDVVDGISIETVPDNLSPQIDAIAQFLDVIGVARIGHIGHEADDVLGALVANNRGQTHVVTGDRDLFQLVSDKDKVDVISITKGVKNLEVVNDSYLLNKYGITGKQYADFSTLRGDASDGLPGVKGVGEKTAASLMVTFGSLAAILKAVKDDGADFTARTRAALLDHIDYLKSAQQVVKVRTDAPLPETIEIPKKVANPQELDFLAVDWGVEKHVARLLKSLRISG